MKTMTVKHLTAWILLSCGCFLAGCASDRNYANHEPANSELTPYEYRYLYPRQSYENLSPWERVEEDRRLEYEDNFNNSGRMKKK